MRRGLFPLIATLAFSTRTSASPPPVQTFTYSGVTVTTYTKWEAFHPPPVQTPTFNFNRSPSTPSSSGSLPISSGPSSLPSLDELVGRNDVEEVRRLVSAGPSSYRGSIDDAIPEASTIEMHKALQPYASRAALEASLANAVRYQWTDVARSLLDDKKLSPDYVWTEHVSELAVQHDCSDIFGHRRKGLPLLFLAVDGWAPKTFELLASRGANLDAKDGCGTSLRELVSLIEDEFRLGTTGLGDMIKAGWLRQGQSYEKGEGVPRDATRAVAAYDHACDAGLKLACYAEGRLLAADAKGKLARAVDLLARACPDVRASCGLAGDLLDGTHGIAKDAKRARELLLQGCTAKDGLSCRVYATGLAAEGKIAEAESALEAACTYGDGLGCHVGAVMLVEDKRLADGAKQGFERDEKGCKLGSQFACAGLAALYLDGRGATRDAAMAKELAARACAKEVGPGCFLDGSIILGAGGKAGDDAAARASFERGCELGDGPSCLELGAIREQGRGVEKDAKGALDAWQRGCDVGSGPACAAASQMAASGRAGKRDATLAAQLRKRGCAAGYAPACGKGAPKVVFPSHTGAADRYAADFDPAAVARAKEKAVDAKPVPLALLNSVVLSQLEGYQAPPIPSDVTEPYDVRKGRGSEVPSAVDAFVCDAWSLLVDDLFKTRTYKPTPQDLFWLDLRNAINIYNERDFRKVAGYRPWTHWNFVRAHDHNILARETSDYIHEAGLHCP